MNRAHGIIEASKAARLTALFAGASPKLQDRIEESGRFVFSASGPKLSKSHWILDTTTIQGLCGGGMILQTFDEDGLTLGTVEAGQVLSVVVFDRMSGVSFHITPRDGETSYFLLVGAKAGKEHFEIFERHVDQGHERSMCWPNPTIEGVANAEDLAAPGHVLIAARSVPTRDGYVGGLLGRFRFVDEKWP